jgi:hypothetical protein
MSETSNSEQRPVGVSHRSASKTKRAPKLTVDGAPARYRGEREGALSLCARSLQAVRK